MTGTTTLGAPVSINCRCLAVALDGGIAELDRDRLYFDLPQQGFFLDRCTLGQVMRAADIEAGGQIQHAYIASDDFVAREEFGSD